MGVGVYFCHDAMGFRSTIRLNLEWKSNPLLCEKAVFLAAHPWKRSCGPGPMTLQPTQSRVISSKASNERTIMKWDIPPRQPNFRMAALERQSVLTKPTGALGVMEDIAVWLADIQQVEQPQAAPAAAIVFASDHPVSHLGVSAYPREVTPMMVINLATGGAAASVLARFNDVLLYVVDVGAEPYPAPTPAESVQWCRKDVGGVVGDLVTTDAMDDTALQGSLLAGAQAVDALPTDTKVLVLGEMGIGNTTPASAVAAHLLHLPASEMVGPGTGVSGDALQAKLHLVERALTRVGSGSSPLDVLRQLGGREMAAIVGAMGRAAEKRMAILVDGFIVSSAALIAVMHDPRVQDYMWFAHQSAEPGHARILENLNAKPVLHAGLRLGEGSGSLTALPLIRAAVTLHNEMATFEEASVPDRDR